MHSTLNLHGRFFKPLMPVGKKRSYVLIWTISYLSTIELLLMIIKKLILCNVLTECTSMQTN